MACARTAPAPEAVLIRSTHSPSPEQPYRGPDIPAHRYDQLNALDRPPPKRLGSPSAVATNVAGVIA
jgi:hypothetical protein